jgi:hypothetical protein
VGGGSVELLGVSQTGVSTPLEYPFSIPPPMSKCVSECRSCTGRIRLEDGRLRLYIEPAYPVVRGRYATIVRGRKAGVANFGWLPVRSGPGRIQTHDTRSRKPLETTSRLEECRFLSPSFVIPVERYYTEGLS